MKNSEKISEKRTYINPTIMLIKLDNEISLALESAPPVAPGESFRMNNNNPFKQELSLV